MPKVEILQQKGHNFLWIDDLLCMWDIPTEIREQKQVASEAYGEVLVAGYGLGMVQKYLTENLKVKSVLTIEKLEEVANLAKKTYGKIYGDVEINDFYNYNSERKFDCVIGDIWKDITPWDLGDYKKFKNKAKKLVKENGKILAWGQRFFEYLLKNEGIGKRNEIT